MFEYDIYNSDIPKGRWYNKFNNKDSFVLKDMLLDATGDMTFLTDDGRTLTSEQMDKYIQSDKPLEIDTHNDLQHSQNRIKHELDNEGLYVIDDECMQSNNETDTSVFGSYIKPKSLNDSIMDKALAGMTLPEVSLHITWDDFPEKEISVLKDIMQIDLSEIQEYIIRRMTDADITKQIREDYEDYLRTRINAL